MTLRIGGRDVESIDNVGQTVLTILHTMNSKAVADSEGLSYCWYPDSSDEAKKENTGFAARMKYIFTD